MLQREIDPEIRADVEKFEEQLARYLAGDLAEDAFRVFRLNNGVYGQRQGGHNQMVRVKVPYGSITPEQLDMFAHIAETYSRGWGHLTTRQNVQFHFVQLEQTPEILRLLRALPGRKILFTNAPTRYSTDVVRHLGLRRHFSHHVAIEDMHVHGQLRPKPSKLMMRRLGAAGWPVPEKFSDTMLMSYVINPGLPSHALGNVALPMVYAGIDLRGRRDRTGYELRTTQIAVADELAGAAELVLGKTAGVPAALVRGVDVRGDGTAAELVMPSERDLFP